VSGPEERKDFEGRIALVTGGSRGIGASIATLLAARGARVIVAARGLEQAREVASRIEAAGGHARAAELDISSEDSVGNVLPSLLKDFGRIDLLVNNAGVTRDNLVMRIKPRDWDEVIGTNLRGAFLVSRAVIPQMVRNRFGRIVSITSVVGQMGNAGQVNYSASKAGLIGMTKSLARELASRNITVNAVAPGYIETDMTRGLSADQKEKLSDLIPLARLGTPEDVAETAAFLLSEAASYINGAVINVNGGMYM